MTSPVQLQHYIDGAWVPGTGSPITSYNPARPDEVVAQGLQAGPAEVEQAMTAAVAAKREWARTPAHERGAVLLRAAVVIEQNAEAWGLELAREEGKTRAEGQGEVLRAAQIFRYYGNDGDRTAGEIFSSPRRGEKILVTRKPLGVVGAIIGGFIASLLGWVVFGTRLEAAHGFKLAAYLDHPLRRELLRLVLRA